MAALGAASWAVAAALYGRDIRLAVLAGLAGPLIVAAVSWIAIERSYRRRPAAVTSVMVAGFGAKVVFVGAYVAVMLALVEVPPAPFVISFTCYFIAFYVVEALLLRRLMSAGTGTGT
jgi:hypothetical protein